MKANEGSIVDNDIPLIYSQAMSMGSLPVSITDIVDRTQVS